MCHETFRRPTAPPEPVMDIAKEDILFLSPSKPIIKTILEVFARTGQQFLVHEAVMDDAVRLANASNEKNGTKVIVSNGGTASLLKRRVQAHILEIRYTNFDLVHAITTALEYSPSVAIVGFESFIYNAVQVRDFFKSPLLIETVDSLDEIRPRIARLVKNGVGAFVGGSPVVNAAREAGAHGVHIDMEKRVIYDAIEESIRIVRLHKEKDLRLGTINALLDSISEGIIGLDEEGRITEINRNAQGLFGLERQAVIGRPIRQFLSAPSVQDTLQTGEEHTGDPCQLGNNLLSVTSVPIRVNGDSKGAVVTIQEVHNIQNMEQKLRKAIIASGHFAKNSFTDVIGTSEAMQRVKERAETYARVDSTVLIYGKTGTGKELFAQSIHNASRRAGNPFVAVNCAALPESLLESELFGYASGAFTGARAGGKTGLFEMANTGTIFLDEVSEMAPSLQPRLLRVLQEKEVSRVGDDKITPVDVRVIAATNKDLMELVEKGTFREDLYYRLAVLILELPPLKERIGDLRRLANFIVRKKSKALHRIIEPLSEEAVEQLRTIDWPGNVRQLANVLERAIVISPGRTITDKILADAMGSCRPFVRRPPQTIQPAEETPNAPLQDVERSAVLRALKECGGNRKQAALRLGISRSTLWRRLKEWE